MEVYKGKNLSFKNDVIDDSGCIIFGKGEKVEVSEVIETSYRMFFNKPIAVKLKGLYGLWSLSNFCNI
jgi:hypothetical protein